VPRERHSNSASKFRFHFEALTELRLKQTGLKKNVKGAFFRSGVIVFAHSCA